MRATAKEIIIYFVTALLSLFWLGGGEWSIVPLRPRLALACSYLPAEIPLLFGLEPVRPCPDRDDLRAAEGLLPRDYCPYARGLVGRLARRPEEFLGLALTTCCDPLRRAADALRYFGRPEQVFLVDLPRRATPAGRRYFAGELRRFAGELARASGRAEPAGYPGCWREVRPPGSLLPPDGEAHWSGLVSPLAAAELGLSSATSARPANQANPASPIGGPRLVVGGTCLLDSSLLEALDRLGAAVVGLDTCLGERGWFPDIPAGDDPWLDLASAYLARPPCPRMQDTAGRRAWLSGLLGRGGPAAGLVWFSPKFCDQAAYELPWLKKTFPGLPLLFLEGEMGAGGTGQVLTRLEAFLEEIFWRSRADHA